MLNTNMQWIFSRSDPPDKNTTLAAQQLLRIVESTEEGLHRLDYIDDFRVNNVEIVEEIIRIRSLEESISTAFICVTFPMFHKQVSVNCESGNVA